MRFCEILLPGWRNGLLVLFCRSRNFDQQAIPKGVAMSFTPSDSVFQAGLSLSVGSVLPGGDPDELDLTSSVSNI